MLPNKKDEFPLSKQKKIKGSRRMAREKVLQILFAVEFCDTPVNTLISHIFFRRFNFGDDEENIVPDKLLTPDEINELDADVTIDWTHDELEFGRNLTTRTIETLEETNELIIKFAKNWEIERIAPIDRILMRMSITELLKFREIPPKVSINESIEIAKRYSTPKSGNFINGVLDSVHEELKKSERMKKSGRGLIDK